MCRFRLTPEEALVLFDFLGRWIEEEKGKGVRPLTKSDAEIWVLNSAYCELERVLAEPFLPNYAQVVEKAREEVQSRNGGQWPLA